MLSIFISRAQVIDTEINQAKDSIKAKRKADLIHNIGNGYIPLKYFNLDLRYLIKFNQYEGIRTGLGGVTSDKLSKKFRINGYTVYGFKDSKYKYSIGAGFVINQKHNTWINASYTDDLQETASTKYLTDKRIFQFFEPRLLNISLFYHHIMKSISLQHDFSPKLNTETQFFSSAITPEFDYTFVTDQGAYSNYDLAVVKTSLLWSPFDIYKPTPSGPKKTKNSFPKLTFQYTQSINGALDGDFNFQKVDFKATYHFIHNKESHTELDFATGIAIGDAPLTHLYHAYPNNINKATIMQRFSVAGLNSFETMYFNEFFSDMFSIFQFKHFFKPFYHSTFSKPQLVLLSRFAIGDMRNPEQHQGLTFNTLDKGYLESGFELNQLVFGFGLSLTYRYGAYHLPEIEDNIALKFTFNVTL
ncbi:conserved hypothetical protein [Formosa agariphila KMM 3901]|uniref:Uncharacterized protein n=1 Tax=Formosa agariphila (strain DSM 15362 / KCTC 12365 / LMG 23005 / KMM 3901 / M-2Alg 35-1) TaxID=1347342 RepID=T2KIU5_FORAG|nr:hypothetical protein [Formosa agariphila]CDF77904.1 conserved hypothetical protein [Formosa agariphila KMM 3901]